MKQIKVGGLLVWDDEYFQRGAFARHAPEVDADEAGDALVAAVLKRPERAAALAKAMAEPRKPQPYRRPAWALFGYEDERAEAKRDDERMRDQAEVAAAREFNRECREER